MCTWCMHVCVSQREREGRREKRRRGTEERPNCSWTREHKKQRKSLEREASLILDMLNLMCLWPRR